MAGKVRFIWTIAVLVTLVAVPAVAQEDEAALRLEAVSDDTGEGVHGLSFNLTDFDGESVMEGRTDEEGHLVMVVGPGEYQIGVSFQGTTVPKSHYRFVPEDTVDRYGRVVLTEGSTIELTVEVLPEFFEDEDENGLYDWWEEGQITFGTPIDYDDDDDDLEDEVVGEEEGKEFVYMGIVFMMVGGILAGFGYSKIRRARLLDHSTRQTIYDYVHSKPGSHLRKIKDDLGLPMGVLHHHINRLEREELIKSRNVGQYKRYFANGFKPVAETLLNEPQKAVYDQIMANPGIGPRDIASALELSRRNVYYHLETLRDMGLIRSEKNGKTLHLYCTSAG